MPVAPRANKTAEAIANKLLGKPKPKKAKITKHEKRLIFEETTRVR